ncbi:hypothetical protein B566_EDAN015398 [Ephemera danica]|nr:hypothetical protein B566_EDAN015398 [Ephemera danica]
MNEEEFNKWLQESIGAYKGMTQMQQCLAVCKLVESVEPEVKYTLFHKLNSLLQKDILTALPTELQEVICDYLDVKSLINSSRVSKDWNRIISSVSTVWRSKCLELGVALPTSEDAEVDWKKLCVRALRTYQNLRCGYAFQNQSIQSSTIPVTTLSYSDGNIKGILMWNLKPLQIGGSAKFLQELIETQSSITSMKLCMEKGVLVCGYGTGKIDIIEVKIFKNTAVGRILHELQAHSECILTLSICEEYDVFASGSSDQTAKLWHLNTGELLHCFPIHPHWVIHVSLSSPEPDRIVMLTHTQTCLQVFWWPASSGPSSMSHKTFQYRFPQPLITTAGCYIREQTLYFVEQCWPSQTPHMAYLVKREIGEVPQMCLIPIMRKVRNSSSPDQSQIVMGDCSWLDGLGSQNPGDLVVAVALRAGDIHAVTWTDLTTTTG